MADDDLAHDLRYAEALVARLQAARTSAAHELHEREKVIIFVATYLNLAPAEILSMDSGKAMEKLARAIDVLKVKK